MSFMDSNSAKWGYWGAGCLLDIVRLGIPSDSEDPAEVQEED